MTVIPELVYTNHRQRETGIIPDLSRRNTMIRRKLNKYMWVLSGAALLYAAGLPL